MSIRVAVVDDQALVRSGFSMVLGYQSDIVVVAEASNGLEAIEVTRAQRPDVVLMDIRMPEMDGLEATRVIRDPDSKVLDHDIVVIALTGHALKGDRQRYLDVGMNDYLSKPIDPEALYDVVVRNLPAA
jgi:CheY-like chemotaxis protein